MKRHDSSRRPVAAVAATSLALLTLLSLLAPVPVSARADKSLRQQFQAEHDRQVRAFNRKNLNAFLTHYTPSVTIHQADGKTMDYAAWRGFVQTILPAVKRVVTHRHRVVKLTPEGKEYRARIEENEAYDIVDKPAMFGKKDAPHYLTNDSVYEETWTRTPTGWKVRDVKFLSEKQTLDHKPVTAAQ